MKEEKTQREREFKLSRSKRAKEASERMHKALDGKDDWWGKCRVCGQVLEGTVAAIREHAHA